jgi:hypothetical protein
MSKCGYCGFEGNIGEHTVLECRTKSIPKVLYERACVWMANEENPEDFYEDFETGVAPDEELPSKEEIKLQAGVWQTEEAMDIMYELTQIYQRGD